MKGSNTYLERQSVPNIGEILFEEYCQQKGYQCVRLGFDEKKDPIRQFSGLNSLLRNIPDYIVDTGLETYVVMVKGTENFKKKEIDLIPLFLEWYSTNKCPLVYAFCFTGQQPKLIFPEKVMQLYHNSFDQKWSDGVIYRNLSIKEQS